MKFARLFIAAFLAIVAGLFVSGPAQAAQNCGTGDICFYDSSVSASPFHFRDGADTSGECHTIGSTVTSWVRNQTSRAWRVFDGTLCSGFQQTINAGTSAALNSQLNNRARSYRRV